MSVYHHILVALDGSADSLTALRHAVTLAREQNATLTLLSVVPHQPTPVGPGVAPPAETDETHGEIIKDALALVPGDVGVTTRLEHGDVPTTILKAVGEDQYDLLVMAPTATAASTARCSARSPRRSCTRPPSRS